jgi:predicted enzyme related to lactoylglutathione lyase
MLADRKTFSGFAVSDVDAAKRFYGETLGLPVQTLDEEYGINALKFGDGREVIFYAKPDLRPGNYTILNFEVDDIDAAVEELSSRGVEFQRYEDFDQDEKGIARGPGPAIAWFEDPAGNILAVMQQPQ